MMHQIKRVDCGRSEYGTIMPLNARKWGVSFFLAAKNASCGAKGAHFKGQRDMVAGQKG
jgi:hypothetical protein